MSRLIDADALIEELKMQCADCMECKERSIGGIVKGAINDCIKIVDRQPTAYDVDAVVEQINKASETMSENSLPHRYYKAIGTRKCEQIVRNGGNAR